MNDNSITPIILASGSPRRRELLSLLGLPLEVMPSEADESFPPEWEPERIVSELALRKAEAVHPLAGERDAIIVGSDTIVVLDGRVLGKPVDAEDSKVMLAALQGRSHKVYTGVACIKLGDGRNDTLRPEVTDNSGSQSVRLGDLGQYSVLSESPDGEPVVMAGYTESKVTFRPMSGEEIDDYIKTGEPLDKAGSYGIQGIGSVFVEKIEGDFYSVMGLPLNLLYQMLLKYNVCPFKIG
ncbi:Maf family protein [Paenibacillus rhizophilus]|uniref:dTTP/UTP pyrophosphatase n=1 Tax=Paenibacillus rhizophilus TaxID=1850366 RepID=A0A3N9P880_9BACL|nr:Maf family protein [Paenibacillus rhizophilus]RQW12463.1 Maf-like protein [Paenibacillus rhizophilus]